MKLFMIPVIRAHLARQVNSESSHTLSRSFETTFWSYDYLFVFFFRFTLAFEFALLENDTSSPGSCLP